MYVQLGDQVKQGQLIAQIDSIRQENELKTAKANIQNQRDQLEVQQANLAKVEAEYKRQQAMFSQDATSRAELETALANFKTAQAQIAAINAQIEQSRLTLATAQENLGYTSIIGCGCCISYTSGTLTTRRSIAKSKYRSSYRRNYTNGMSCGFWAITSVCCCGYS